MHFLPQSIDDYAVDHTQKEPELLARLARETHQKVLQPRMLSGHYQGRLLSLLSRIIRPVIILELGTYTGYSALCLAEGLTEGGALHTIDINEELYDLQRKYFDLSPYKDRIHQHVGDALEILPALELQPDLVFIDADKPRYPEYFHLLIPKMKSGGIILTDNVLWSGKVVEAVKPDDESTRALLEYNRLVADDSRVETVMLPVRDGLSITRVK